MDTVLYKIPSHIRCKLRLAIELRVRLIMWHELLFKVNLMSYIWCETEFTNQKKYITLKDLMVALCLTEAWKIWDKTTSFMNET